MCERTKDGHWNGDLKAEAMQQTNKTTQHRESANVS
ncbi:hypothetical protein CBM2631_B180013 [Cupriavidus taiwanensis]|nr:hypothetical protein CBM2618_B200013 [Cupriavidus taiwanensis]SOZ89965.1 hypothetical protein CBM2622_B190013 [Cupriavidus taiwanensis]SPA20304.1 hypothetical protein CBM2631_B180013 [Cupriavidus taiwanensis]